MLEILTPGFAPTPVPYLDGWDLQRRIHADVVGRTRPDTLILLEHEAVYTAGKRTEPQERPQDGTPVIDVDRGGKITWHGPGQLVGYPIIKLPDRVGVVDHVRRVEQAVIDVLAQYGIMAGRVPGRTGVWLPADDPDFVAPVATGPHHAKSVERTGHFTPGALQIASVEGQTAAVPSPGRQGRPERKICAIGIRVTRRTTMHGFALNISNDSAGFDNIVPCGIADATVTSMADELDGPAPSLLEVAERLEPLLDTHLSREGNLTR